MAPNTPHGTDEQMDIMLDDRPVKDLSRTQLENLMSRFQNEPNLLGRYTATLHDQQGARDAVKKAEDEYHEVKSQMTPKGKQAKQDHKATVQAYAKQLRDKIKLRQQIDNMRSRLYKGFVRKTEIIERYQQLLKEDADISFERERQSAQREAHLTEQLMRERTKAAQAIQSGAQATPKKPTKKWYNKLIGDIQKFLWKESFSDHNPDIVEWLTNMHRKIDQAIDPEIRTEVLFSHFGDEEQAILQKHMEEYYSEHSVHMNYKQLAAQAAVSFANPNLLEKTMRRLTQRKQSQSETVEQLLIDLDAFRSQLTRLGEPISDAQYRMVITKAIKPEIIKQVTNQTDSDGNLYQQWPFEYFRQQLIARDPAVAALAANDMLAVAQPEPQDGWGDEGWSPGEPQLAYAQYNTRLKPLWKGKGSHTNAHSGKGKGKGKGKGRTLHYGKGSPKGKGKGKGKGRAQQYGGRNNYAAAYGAANANYQSRNNGGSKGWTGKRKHMERVAATDMEQYYTAAEWAQRQQMRADGTAPETRPELFAKDGMYDHEGNWLTACVRCKNLEHNGHTVAGCRAHQAALHAAW